MELAINTIIIRQERDLVVVRRRVRQIAELLGFVPQDNTRLTTAVSEIARNCYDYAGGGRAEFIVEGKSAPQTLLVRISDRGSGIADLKAILDGTYKSPTGMGLGITGSRRLLDDFKIETSKTGTVAELRKTLPRTALLVNAARLRELTDHLLRESAGDPFEEIQRQNQDLLQTLAELRASQENLMQLNRELEDTNRGVVALYAELDRTAEELRRADAAKTQFLSNMSHEFRTPLNSQLALTSLLLERTDGELSAEQEKQVSLVRRGTQSLLELVNDLLDLAKIAAGKTAVRPEEFTVRDLFSTLRGMIRPLLASESVELVFEETEQIPPLLTDEGKVAQILRNFLSNALKFTTDGEVRVSAAFSPDERSIIFAVADTGIGIAPEDQLKIFEEFTQLDNSEQKKHKGTGLGLPLSRKLAELLGGTVSVESEPGRGTTFFARIPCVYGEIREIAPPAEKINFFEIEAVPIAKKILIIDDDEAARYVLRKLLGGDRNFVIYEAAGGAEGLDLARKLVPEMIFLDWEMPGVHGREVLNELKAEAATALIPVAVVTSVEPERLCGYLDDVVACLSKKDLTAGALDEVIHTQLEKK